MSAKCLVNTNTSSKKYTLSDNEVLLLLNKLIPPLKKTDFESARL